jgi:hypothetical protein
VESNLTFDGSTLSVSGTVSTTSLRVSTLSGTAGAIMVSSDTLGTARWSNEYIISEFATTTNATAFNIATISTVNSRSYTTWAWINGRGATGATYACGGDTMAVFRTSGAGTVTEVNETSTVMHDFPTGTPNWNWAVSGSNIVLQVSGVANHTVSWHASIHYIIR